MAVMEERSELTVSPTGGDECFRTVHILTPSAASAAAVPPEFSSSDPGSEMKYKDLPFNVNFLGWKFAFRSLEKWKMWVDRMKSLHHSTWEEAGISDAIVSSTYEIQRNNDLIFGFFRKWCPDTNSFVFTWGEATITLEDVMVLGGYSVLGEFVSKQPGNGEIDEVLKKLQDARSEINKSKSKKALQGTWMDIFMDSESEIEHEAFLAYWLSRFVFPISRDVVSQIVLPIAVRLAEGTRIALAPAVLASIYKSLTLLKVAIASAREAPKKESQKSVAEISVSAPLALVQAWIWERFPSLRPFPKPIGHDKPRLARWHELKNSGVVDVMHEINSAAEDFQWRPYLKPLSNFHGVIYQDKEYRALIGPDSDDDLQKLVRCLRPSELIGIESKCREQYLPHRVAMQFGLDQDIPGHVERVDSNPEVSWSDYSRPVTDTRLYIPPRLSEPRVTARYLKWWKKLNLGQNVPQQMPEIRQGSSEKRSCKSSKLRKRWDHIARVSPSPGFSPVKESEPGVRIKETGLTNQRAEHGREENRIGAECSWNTGVDPSQVRRSRSEVVSSEKGSSKCLNRKNISTNNRSVSPPPGFARKHNNLSGKPLSSTANDRAEVVLSEGGTPNCLKGKRISANDGSDSPPPGFARKHNNLSGKPLSSTANDRAEFVSSKGGSSKCLKGNSISANDGSDSPPPGFARKHSSVKEHVSGAGIKETGAEVSSSGRFSNNQLQERGPNTEVNPSSVKSRTDELILGLEKRITNIEKLCHWIKTGKLDLLREIGKQLEREAQKEN